MLLSCPISNNNNKSLANCTLYRICCCTVDAFTFVVRCIASFCRRWLSLLFYARVHPSMRWELNLWAVQKKQRGGRPAKGYFIQIILLLQLCSSLSHGIGGDAEDTTPIVIKPLNWRRGNFQHLIISCVLLNPPSERGNEKKTVVAASCLANKQTQQGRLRRSRRTRLGTIM